MISITYQNGNDWGMIYYCFNHRIYDPIDRRSQPTWCGAIWGVAPNDTVSQMLLAKSDIRRLEAIRAAMATFKLAFLVWRVTCHATGCIPAPFDVVFDMLLLSVSLGWVNAVRRYGVFLK